MNKEIVPLVSKSYILSVKKMSGYSPVTLGGKVLLFSTSEEAIKYRDQREWLSEYRVMYEIKESNLQGRITEDLELKRVKDDSLEG